MRIAPGLTRRFCDAPAHKGEALITGNMICLIHAASITGIAGK